MRTKASLALLGLGAVASGFTQPDPIIPDKPPKKPNDRVTGLSPIPGQSVPKAKTIPGKDRVLNDWNKRQAAAMQWFFRTASSAVLRTDWSDMRKEIEPELVARFTDPTLQPPAYYKKVLVHGMSPLMAEQAQAEEPSMRVLSSVLAKGESLYDLSMQMLDRQKFIDADDSKSSDLRVVDIGCGTGTLTHQLLAEHAERISHVDAVDASPFKLSKFYKATQEDDLAKVSLHHMLGENLHAIEDNSVDRVLLSFVFHELPQGVCRKMMNEAWRVLRPGGTIHIVDMDNKNPRTMNLGSSSVGNWLMEPYMDSFLKMDMPATLSRLNFTDIERASPATPAPIAGYRGRKPLTDSAGGAAA